MDAICCQERHRREQRVRGRRERNIGIFFHTFIYFEHIIQTYRLPCCVIFYLLQEIKDDLETSTRSHAIPTLSKLLQPLIFWPLVLFNILWLISFFTLYSRLRSFSLRLLYCVGRYVNEMLRLCSLICALLLNHRQKCPFPSALFWNCALALICPV